MQRFFNLPTVKCLNVYCEALFCLNIVSSKLSAMYAITLHALISIALRV